MPEIEGQPPLFSIVTIALNVAGEIETTARSVLSQSYDNFEYIIIDGGSTDGTTDLIKEFAQSAKVRWISEPDSGTSEATNKGWQMANGSLVAFLNAGDWYEDDTLKRVAEQAQQFPKLILHGNIAAWDQQDRPYCIYSPSTGNDPFIRINHAASFIPREYLEQSGGFSGKYQIANDFEFYRRIQKLGYKFHFLDTVLTNYRLGGMSDTNWLSGYIEVYQARIEHGARKVPTTASFLLSVVVTTCRRFFEKVGLGHLVQIYRTRCAAFRQLYDTNKVTVVDKSDLTK